MNTAYKIHYLNRQQIDAAKWNNCISLSPNRLVYASPLYLDSMAGRWNALVLEDYQAVMPLVWRRKWGVRYLYHPPLTPQLGIFSPYPITEAMIRAFITEAMRYFRFAEIFLNFGNHYPGLPPFVNIVLDLAPAYDTLLSRYKPDLIQNLRQSARHPMHYLPASDVDSAVNLYIKYYAARTPHVRPADYNRFAGFCRQAMKDHDIIIRVVLPVPAANREASPVAANREAHPTPGEPLALALLLKYHNRLYLLMSVCPPDGRKTSANHFLLDNLIREFAGTHLTLDFDGSEIPGIAHFYMNFGGKNQPFFFLRWNKLPWPLRLLKPASNYQR